MDLIVFLGAIAGGILINLIASELFAWGPWLSELLLRRAVQRLAPEMQHRMHEEWTGHLQAIPPGLWRIVAAAGFVLATHQINVALQVRDRPTRRQRKQPLTMVSGRPLRSSPFAQGSFALQNHIRLVPGNHDTNIDMIVITHPDDDHLNGLVRLIQYKTFRDRRTL